MQPSTPHPQLCCQPHNRLLGCWGPPSKDGGWFCDRRAGSVASPLLFPGEGALRGPGPLSCPLTVWRVSWAQSPWSASFLLHAVFWPAGWCPGQAESLRAASGTWFLPVSGVLPGVWDRPAQSAVSFLELQHSSSVTSGRFGLSAQRLRPVRYPLPCAVKPFPRMPCPRFSLSSCVCRIPPLQPLKVLQKPFFPEERLGLCWDGSVIPPRRGPVFPGW